MAYPLPKFHFSIEWSGTRVGFTEATGLDKQTEVIEYREGNSPNFNKVKMPGLQKFSNITLKRGTIAGDLDYYTWVDTISMNTVKRRDVTIHLLDETHQPVISWKVINAWPVKVQASDLKADGNEVAIETLELAHEGLEVIK
ncbi:MAG TPA: phage tail protein [Mucilaginibacter sp.]|nr:phage tail protein [Mucilaginibacter sp.]